MAEPNQQNNPTNRGQDAKRIGLLGMVAGAVFGLFAGGSFIQMALLFGGAGALTGAVAGEKITPLMNKWIEIFRPDSQPLQVDATAQQIQPHIQPPARIPTVSSPLEPMVNAQIAENYADAPGSFEALAGRAAEIQQAAATVNAQAHTPEANAPHRLPDKWARDAHAAQAQPTHAGSSMRQ